MFVKRVFFLFLQHNAIMKRDIYKKLASWKHDKYRKPLILKGARQVGKTYILSKFAKEYPNSLYINFEEMPSVIPIFEGDLASQQYHYSATN